MSVRGVSLDNVIDRITEGSQVVLVLKDGTTKVFCRHRTVLLALIESVEKELHSLVKTGFLLIVQHSDWVTPCVVVPKENTKVRLCGHYKVTLNPNIKTHHYPSPVT